VNAQTIAALVLAGLAVLGAIGSVARLSYHVGRLVGTVTSAGERAAADSARFWAEIGSINARHDKHLEVFHGGYRDGR
jgi:hypothetical protein